MSETAETFEQPLPLPPMTTDDSAEEKPEPPAARRIPEKRTGVRAAGPVAQPISAELRGVRIAEDRALADIIRELGERGAYTIAVKRLEPEEAVDSRTGKLVNVGGHLKTYDEPVDEEFLAKRHGGGKYELVFKRKNDKGSYVHYTARRVTVAGEPRTDDVHRNIAPTQPAAASSLPTTSAESPQLVVKAFEVLQGELNKKSDRTPEAPRGIDPAVQAMFTMLQEQLKASNAQVEALRREATDSRNAKPAEDPFREKLLDSLMKDDSARLQSVRMMFESEIRQLKEGHAADERRWHDRYERMLSDTRQQFEREIVNLRQTHDIQLQAARAAYDTNIKLLETDNRRLERDNNEVRVEVKDLRAKKEKSLPEQIKEINALKDMIGDDAEDKGTIEKVMEAIPGAIEIAKSYMEKPAQQQQAQAAVQPKRRIAVTPDGQKWMVDDKGKLTPVKKKPQAPAPPQPGPDGLPVIDPNMVATVAGYLERAYANNTDPEVFAQSSRSMVPEEILVLLREHGIDPFLTKVAKLPSTSPLMNQAGKNWVRKVAKELVGE